jgi:O-antigen polymerase
VVFSWLCYVVFNGNFINRNFNLFHIYLIICGCLLLVTYILIITNKRIIYIVFTVITFLAFLESFICFAQYFQLIKSKSGFFPVTGSCENPNVTAMFLVMSLPAVLNVGKLNEKTIRHAITGVGICIFLSLLLLNCRTAYIGLAIVLFYWANDKFGIVSYLKKVSLLRKLGVIMIAFTLIFAVGNELYKGKKTSADGRVLIWKLSMQMFLKHPLTGVGYGRFEHDYNLYQAEYLKSIEATESEKKSAGYVHMSYNEYLQNGVEGGLIGLLLWCLIMSVLLSNPTFVSHAIKQYLSNKQTTVARQEINQEEHLAAYSGIAAFVVMSMVNFTVQAVPVFCVFIVYGAIVATARSTTVKVASGRQFEQINFTLSKKLKYPLGGLVLSMSCLATLQITKITLANYRNNQGAVYATKGNAENAIAALHPLSNQLNEYESYWINYGNVLFSKKDYKNALTKYNKAKSLTSNPIVYLRSGYCDEQIGNHVSAASNYELAVQLEPQKIEARYLLMHLYNSVADTARTVFYAKEILDLPIKIQTNRAYFYKKEANLTLKKYKILYKPSVTLTNIDYSMPKAIKY